MQAIDEDNASTPPRYSDSSDNMLAQKIIDTIGERNPLARAASFDATRC